MRRHHATERNDRDFRRPAADINDHIPLRGMDRNSRSDRRQDRLLHDVGCLGTSLESSIHHGTPFRRCHSGRNGEHDFRPKQTKTARHLVDEVTEHRFGHPIIRDRAITKRLRGDDSIRRPTEHFLGLVPDGQYLVLRERNGHHRWLVDNNPLPRHEYQGIGRPKIDPYFPNKRHTRTPVSRNMLSRSPCFPLTAID